MAREGEWPDSLDLFDKGILALGHFHDLRSQLRKVLLEEPLPLQPRQHHQRQCEEVCQEEVVDSVPEIGQGDEGEAGHNEVNDRLLATGLTTKSESFFDIFDSCD